MSDWTDDQIAALRQLWSEGLSTAEIGRRMGITKNAVVGKAHRLDLAPRPSPIRRAAAAPAPVAPPPIPISKPPLPGTWLPAEIDTLTTLGHAHRGIAAMAAALPGRSERAIMTRLSILRQEGVDIPHLQPERVVTVVPIAASAAPSVAETSTPAPILPSARLVPSQPKSVPLRAGLPCQWPTTNPGTRRHRFVCEEARVLGCVYCAIHHAEAHKPVKRPISSLMGMAMRIARGETVRVAS